MKTRVNMELTPFEYSLIKKALESYSEKCSHLMTKDLDLFFTKKVTKQKKIIDEMLKELFD